MQGIDTPDGGAALVRAKLSEIHFPKLHGVRRKKRVHTSQGAATELFDFWTVLVELLVRLLVAFPTVARGFWFLFHGFFTSIRAAFGGLLMAVCARHGQNERSQALAVARILSAMPRLP